MLRSWLAWGGNGMDAIMGRNGSLDNDFMTWDFRLAVNLMALTTHGWKFRPVEWMDIMQCVCRFFHADVYQPVPLPMSYSNPVASNGVRFTFFAQPHR
jgi:hypothetical protein